MLNPDVYPIIGADPRRGGFCTKAATDHDSGWVVPLQGVRSDLCDDLIVRAVIPTANDANAAQPIVRHRVVSDARLHGVLLCFADSAIHVNTLSSIRRDCVASNGRVRDAVTSA